MTPEGNYMDELSWSEKSVLNRRDLHKEEMIEIILEITDDLVREPLEDERVTDLRQIIRERVGYRTDKSPSSELSSSELRNLSRSLDHVRFLEAEDFGDFWIDTNKHGSVINVNGDRHTLTGKKWDRGRGEAAYDKFEMYKFGSRLRLMLLFDLDKNECKYDHSVVLEEAHDYGPYKRWKKKSYVDELEVVNP